MSSSLRPLRQSVAEIAACAFCEMFPDALMVNSVISDIGFHYDFVLNQQLQEHVLPLIEERMRALVQQDLPMKTLEMMRENAVNYFTHLGQEIKADLVGASTANIVQIFKMGDFTDTCSESFLESTKEITAFRLQKISRETIYAPSLGTIDVLRLHGTAFPDPMSLKQFLKRVEKAKKRDHRQLGTELGLYTVPEGTDTPIWSPKGMVLREFLINLWRKAHQGQKLHSLSSSRVVPASLLKIALNKEEARKRKTTQTNFLSLPIEEQEYFVCPDPTPLHAIACSATTYTQQQLPIAYNEWVEIADPAPSTHLWGLFKTRVYTSDITQILCTSEQVVQELISCLQFIDKIIKMFGFEHQWYLSTRDQIPINYKNDWRLSVDHLVEAMKACEFEYILDKQGSSPYGPRVEARLVDALGRHWTAPYVGLNTIVPEKAALRYQTEDDRIQKPMMITRSIFGSLERIIGILIEHYSGNLPLWVAPEQVRVIPIAKRNNAYTKIVTERIEATGFRAYIDYGTDTLGAKVHAAEIERIPYIVIIGDKEEKNQVINVRSCYNKTESDSMTLDHFIEQLIKEVCNNTLHD